MLKICCSFYNFFQIIEAATTMIHCCRPWLDLDPMFGPGLLGKQPGIQARAKSKRSEPSRGVTGEWAGCAIAHPVLGSYLFMPSRGSFMRTGNNEMTNQRTFIDVCYDCFSIL